MMLEHDHKQGATPRVSRYFYKAAVQLVGLVAVKTMQQAFQCFHHQS